MKRIFEMLLLIAVFCIGVLAQSSTPAKAVPVAPPSPVIAVDVPMETAKATLAAHGGDKLKNIKSLVARGTVDLNVFGQAIPTGAFSMAFSGDKYFIDINTVARQLKQVFDGKQMYSTIEGFSLPPITSLGFPLLPRIGDAGFIISALPETAKNRKGFRMTTPEGFYTDFFVDEKTKQVKGYESSYDVGGRNVTTSVEVDEWQVAEGITIPKKYSQRFDLGQMTAYAAFKANTILVNSTIEDSAFMK